MKILSVNRVGLSVFVAFLSLGFASLAAAVPNEVQAAIITISVDDSQATYTPGETGTYLITVSNSGDADMTGIRVTNDALPSGMSIISWDCNPNSDCSANNGTGNINTTVSVDQSSSVTIDVEASYASSTLTDMMVFAVRAVDTGNMNAVLDTDSDSDSIDLESVISVNFQANANDDDDYTPGLSETFTIEVSNAGPSDVSNVQIVSNNVVAFENISWVCNDDATSNCDAASGNAAINTTVDIEKDGTVTFVVDVDYFSSATLGTLVFDIDATNPNGSDESDTKSLDRKPVSNITMTMSDGDNAYTPGLNGQFVTVINNSGPSDVMGVDVQATQSVAFENFDWTCAAVNGSCQTATGTTDDTSISLQRNGQITINYNVDYYSDATENPLMFSVGLTKPADVTGTTPGTLVDNNDALDRQVNLSVVKTGKGGFLVPNEPFEYTLLIANAGPSDLGAGSGETGLNIIDVFDGNLAGQETECIDGSKPCWRYCPSTAGPHQGSVTLDDCPGELATYGFGEQLNASLRLASGASAEVKAYVRVQNNTVGTDCDGDPMTTELGICNTASISIDSSETSTTRNIGSSNDLSDSVFDEIRIGTDLVVTKTDDNTAVPAGENNSYSIIVRNNGYINVDGISVSDILPLFSQGNAGFVPGSIAMSCQTVDEGACCVSQTTACGFNQPVILPVNDELHATIDLEAQSELEFTVTGLVDSRSTGVLTNAASASSPAGFFEENSSNNLNITDTSDIASYTDLEVVKTLKTATPDSVDDSIVHLVYEIKVKNLGPADAFDVMVSDPLNDARLNLPTASWTCSIFSGTGQCQQPGPVTGVALQSQVDLTVDSVALFEVSISSNAAADGVIVNVASAQPSVNSVDPETNNNQSAVEYALSGSADILITHEGAHSVASPATPGLDTSFNIQVKNEGPDNVFSARVQSVFPPELENVNWTCSAVSPIPGDLTFFQQSDFSSVSTESVVSPDGNHIYVASPDPDGVGVLNGKILAFQRNTQVGADFGLISFVSQTEQGVNGVDGIEVPEAMIMTQDGRFLYVLSDIYPGSGAKRTVAVFARDNNHLSASFGELSFAGVAGDLIETSLNDLAISPDMKHLYLTADDQIVRFDIDQGSGGLSNPIYTDNTNEAGVMQFYGDYLYVADAIGNEIKAYSRDGDALSPDYGDLSLINTLSDGTLSAVKDMVVSQDGKHLYLASQGSDRLVMVERDLSTGFMTFEIAYDDLALALNALETLVGISSIEISPDGQHVFVGNQAQSRWLLLGRNSQGSLSKQNSDLLDSVSDVVISPDGQHVFMAGAGGMQSLSVFSRRQPDPIFSFVESEFESVNGVAGLLGASAVAVSADGNSVYATGLGSDALVHFDRDKTKGSTADTRSAHLTFVNAYFDGVNSVTGLADVDSVTVSPNGQYVFVGSSDAASLSVFARAQNGSLSFLATYQHAMNQVDGLLGISAVLIDDTSSHLYVTGRFEASIAHYTIGMNGQLTLIGAVSNADSGVSGLAGARSMAFSPGKDFIYVTGSIDDALVVLSRDTTSGEIHFVQKNSFAGDQPMDVAVTSDGEHVYVVSANDSKISVFKRQSNSASSEKGFVSLQNVYQDNVAGFNYLLGVRSVVLSHTGDKVYVGSEFDRAITVLDRDNNPNSLSFGQLSIVEVQIDDVGRVDGLSQLYDLAISNDSKHVYSVGFAEHALSAFVLGSGSSCSALGSGNIDDVVDVGSNGTLTYTITAQIKSNATGNLTTDASFTPPENFTLTNTDNNCSIAGVNGKGRCDDHVTGLSPAYDLAIHKTDNRISATPGEPITYDVMVTNNGPSDARSVGSESVMVQDILNSGFDLAATTWTCQANGSGSLHFIQAILDDEAPYEALQGVVALAFAQNLAGLGPHLVAVSAVDGALMAIAIDPVTGMLGTQTFVDGMISPSLEGAKDVVVIDNHIYVSSQVSDALMVFEASDNMGMNLVKLEQHDFATNQVSGLNQAVAVKASSDGAFIYVAGANDNALVTFARDLITGMLTHETTLVHGDNGTEGLSGINAFAISSDGYNLYSNSANLSHMGVFKRTLIDGQLSFVNKIVTGDINQDLNGISAISLSGDDRTVYVTNRLTHRIYVFDRDVTGQPSDLDFGALSLIQVIEQGVDGVAGLLAPSQVSVSQDYRHVYVTSEQSDAVLWFGRDLETGMLSFGGLVSDLIAEIDGLNGPLDVVMDNTGSYVYVAGSQDHAIAVLTRESGSSCPAAGVGHIASNGVSEGVVVNLAAQGSLQFTIDTVVSANATGSLMNTARVRSCTTPIPSNTNFEDCVGIEPINDMGNNNSTDTDQINPIADLSITKTDGLAQYDGLMGAVQLTGTDRHIYVAANQENAIGVFAREHDDIAASYGEIEFIQSIKTSQNGVSGLTGVSDVLVSLDGKTVFAAGSSDNAIVVFSRDVGTGELTFKEKHSSGVFGVTGIEGVNALAMSSDGKHLYANGPLTSSLAVFTIVDDLGVNHGNLQFKQSLQNAVAGVSGLIAVSDVEVSADGKHVYVSSNSENSVSVFLRNPSSGSMGFGELSYLASYVNGVGGIAGLIGPTALTMNQTGEYLYVLGAADSALVLFARAVDGSLTFVEFKQNGTSGVEGLNGAKDLMLSADEASLYVAGGFENALVKFDRSDIDGRLTFDQVLYQGDDTNVLGQTINGLTGAAGVMVSPDDGHVYIAGQGDDALAVFERDTSNSPTLHGDVEFIQIVKDGHGGVAPGTEIVYTITVVNNGPSDVASARVVDNFPPQFENISYICYPSNFAACNTNVQEGNVNEIVGLPVGGRVEILATGVIKSSATGILSNTATVMPTENIVITDPNLTNNSATDSNTLLSPAADLVVTKTNLATEIIPGLPVSYQITVSNQSTANVANKPSDIQQVLVTDLVPESIDSPIWSCEASPKPGLLDDGDGDDQTSDFIIHSDLDRYTDMVISDNGLFVYVIGESASKAVVAVYARDLRSGELAEIQLLTNNLAGVSGLRGAQRVQLSDDQKHLYVVSNEDDALVSFVVNQSTGNLSFVNSHVDGVDGVNGLGGAQDLILSLDGRHLYVAGKLDDAIAIFNRNTSTGVLTFTSFLAGVEGLNGIDSMAFSASGSHLLVVAEDNLSLASFARNNASGELQLTDVIQDYQAPGTLTMPNHISVVGNQALVSNTDGNGNRVSVFDLGANNDDLTAVDSIAVSSSDGPMNLLLSEMGNELYVANHAEHTVALYHQRMGQYEPFSLLYDTALIPDLDGLSQLVSDQSEGFIYALAGDDLVIMNRLKGSLCSEAGVGQLSDVATIVSGGDVVYTLTGDVLPAVTGQLSNTATALVMPDAIELFPFDNESTDTDLLVPHSDLTISKDDGLLEVIAGTPLSYELMTFSPGPSTVYPTMNDVLPIFPGVNAGFSAGSVSWQCSVNEPLQFNQEFTADDLAGIAGASELLLSADGMHLYISSHVAGTVSVYSKDANGQLVWLQTIANSDELAGGTVMGLSGASSMAFDQDEAYLYVAGESDNTVVLFELTAPGVLDYVTTYQAGNDGIIGMTAPVKLIVTPDNTGLYVAAKGSDAITVFARDENNGTLSFVERVKDGFGTIVPESNVIIDLNGMAASPDGRFIYVTATFSDAISIFERDLMSQTLTFKKVIRSGDNVGGQVVPTLDGLGSPMLTPNGNFLYLLSSANGSMLRFSRNSNNGMLTYEQVIQDGDAGVGPMAMPLAMDFTPGIGRMLIADAATAAVSIYERDSNTGELVLIDVFSNAIDDATLLIDPNLISNDGINIYLNSVSNDALVSIRMTADADCDTTLVSNDVLAIPLEMSPGSAASAHIDAHVHPSARGVIHNTATIDLPLDSVDVDLNNNSSLDTTQIIIETDVMVEKSGPMEAIAGESIAYEITLINDGPSDALGVQLLDVMDGALLNVTWTCSATGRSLCVDASGSGDIDTLMNVTIDGSVTLQVMADIDPNYYGDLINQATAVVIEEGYVTDRDLSNNQSMVTTTVTRVAEVSVSKDNHVDEVVAGLGVVYDIIISNAGPSDAENTLVSDVVPVMLQDVVWQCTSAVGSTCTASGIGDINDTIYLAANSSVHYQLSGNLLSSAGGDLVNTVNIVLGPFVSDLTTDDHTATDSDPIVQIADLELIINDQIDPLDPDGPIPLIYDISVINHGPSDSDNVTFELTIPIQSAQTTNLVDNCEVMSSFVLCELGDLTVGTQVNSNVAFDYSIQTPLTADNTATAYADSFDPDLGNNSQSESTQLITGIDVRVSKNDFLDAIDVGATTSYLIVVENIGSLDAVTIEIDEQLPLGLIDASWSCEAFDGADCVDVDEFTFTGELSIPSGGRVELILTATIDPILQNMSQLDLINTVEVNVLSGNDYHLLNNTASDNNALIFFIFKNGFEELQP